MDTKTIKIEVYDPSIEAIMEVDYKAFGSHSYSPWTIASFIRHGNVYCLYKMSKGYPQKPIGVLVLMQRMGHQDSVYIVGMAIDPDFQDKGLGSKLMADVLDDLRERGTENITLDVSPKNYRAFHIYHNKFGFKLEGFHFNEYGLREDRIFLKKDFLENKSMEKEDISKTRNEYFYKLTDFGNLSSERFLFLKSALLCNGLRANKYSSTLAKWFNPWSVKRTGHVGVHVIIKDMVLNLPMDQIYQNNGIYTNQSPFEILPENKEHPFDENWILVDHEGALAEVSLISVPAWYQLKTSRGIPMPDLFLSEGQGNLMGAIPGKCYYHGQGNPCLFCGFNGTEISNAKPVDYSEVVLAAIRENREITITLTGGNSAEADNGLRRYLPYIREIVKSVKLNFPDMPLPKIQIECSPSNDPKDFDELIEEGVSSFSINMEFFNEDIRKTVCPGKANITRSTYEKTWLYLVDKLGKFYVGSALIYGLEPENDTLNGALYLLSIGVRPNLIPFKPMPGSSLETKPVPDFVGYHRLCTKVAIAMQKARVDLSIRMGCTTCGACTLEESVYKDILRQD